jgi:PAS domain S-box-containing protein
MTWQTTVYFISILITAAVMGFLTWYAWKQRHMRSALPFMWLMLNESALALAEAFSMLSQTQAQAHFWFNLRFAPLAFGSVLWLIFALAYSGREQWLAKRLIAAMFVIPAITQIMVWTNGRHGWWVQQEVAFRQSGPFWIAYTSARIAGPWYWVHTLYSYIPVFIGMVLLLTVAWRKARFYRTQALLLAVGTLIPLVFSLIPTFNLNPQAQFNPIAQGMALGGLLIGTAVFRFQFLKKTPPTDADSITQSLETQQKHTLALFLFIFVLTVIGIVVTGSLSYQVYETRFRRQVEDQISAITELKVAGLVTWRQERLGDAGILYQNPAFSDLVQHTLETPADAQARQQLQVWLDTIQGYYHYDRIFLLDTQGQEQISSPAVPGPITASVTEQAAAALASRQVIFVDFHRDTPTGPIHLAILSPIFAAQDNNRPLGVLVLQIDPNVYLYPFISQWPLPSATAETLLVRRDGKDALYLNSLRFDPDAALNLRISLDNETVPAVRAVLGYEGIMEGTDYRGNQVVADVRAIPDSPWFLVARMDVAEVYAPLRERLWQTVLFIGAFIALAGLGLALVWRQQRLSYLQAQMGTLDALRASEGALRQRENLLSKIFDILPVGLWMADGNGRLTRSNQKGQEIWGAEPLVEQAQYGVFRARRLPSGDEITPDEWALARAINEGITTLDEMLEIDTFDGQKKIILNYATPVLDDTGNISAGVVVNLDITHRKQAEDRLKRQHATLNAILESANTPIFSLDRDYRYTSFNNAHVATMKALYNVEIQIGGSLADYQSNSPDWPTARRNLDLALNGETPTELAYSGEETFARRFYEIAHHPVRTEDGEIIGVSVFVRDITERKQAEDALLAYSTRLEADVQARTHELRDTQEQLMRQERLAVLGQLAGSVGHELRNPLGVISNAIYFLKLTQTDASDKVREYLQIIENETRICDKIITDLLDFTRIKSLEREKTAVSDLIHQTLARFPAPSDITAVLEIPADLPPLYADPGHVSQVFGNVLINAYQAMPQGGKLTFSASVKDGMMCIQIHDTGAGISSENMTKLFEPLFTTKSKGIGLGLAVSKKLAEANGGKIEVQSLEGQGSTFSVYLPLYKEPI